MGRRTFKGADPVASLGYDRLCPHSILGSPSTRSGPRLPACGLPDGLSPSHSLSPGPGGLLPTPVCSLWEISIAFELVIGSEVSDSHYWNAGFKMTPFRVASLAALTFLRERSVVLRREACGKAGRNDPHGGREGGGGLGSTCLARPTVYKPAAPLSERVGSSQRSPMSPRALWLGRRGLRAGVVMPK